MSVQSTAFAASVLVLSLVFVSAAPAKRPPPPPPPSDKTPPTTPTNLRITASSATSISLAWTASTDNSTNWWYCVQVDGAGCYRVDPPQTTFTHPKLAPNRTTTWTVVALDAAGNRSGNSNSVTYTTPPDTTAPSPPPTLTATAVYPTRVSVSWTASVDNVTQVYYALFVNGSQYGAEQIGSRAATVLYLSPSTTYEFRVNARDGYGNTAQSNVLSITTPAKIDAVAPTAPANLRFSSETAPPEAWLNWDQSTDDTDPQSQILYEVYLNGQRFDDGVIGYGSTVTYCRAEGPTEIVLRAVDTSGNVSQPSNQLLFSC